MTESTELARPTVLGEYIQEKRDAIATTLGKAIDPNRFVQVALLMVTKNPDLWKCSKESVLLAIMESARVGLYLDNKEATIIPYYDKNTQQTHAEFMPMVQGIIRLMLRSEDGLKVESRLVREGDDFDFEYGLEPKLTHKPKSLSGPVTHAYATVFRKDVDPQFEVMDREELDLAQATSRAPNSPAYKNWPGEMDRRTVVKRISKYVDLSDEAALAIAVDHALFGDPTMDGPAIGLSDEYHNAKVKRDTEARIAQLKAEMSGNGDDDGDSTTPAPKDDPDLGSAPEEPAESEPKDTPDPEAGTGTGTGTGPDLEQPSERPYPPDIVKASVLEAVERFKGTNRNAKVTEHQTFAELAQWQLNECFNEPAQTELVDQVLQFLFGKTMDSLTGAECRAILSWLQPFKNQVKDLVPNVLSAQEARLIVGQEDA